MLISLQEYDYLYENDLPQKSFTALCMLLDEHVDDGADKVFRMGKKRGKTFLQAQNYVGVLETPDGTTIEILPKNIVTRTSSASSPNSTNTLAPAARITARRTLLQMLRCLKDTPFVQLSDAHLAAAKYPILEVFITAFLAEMEVLIRKGIQEDYVLHEANEPYLRGKLNLSEQLKQNVTRPARFHVEFDAFKKDIPHNRLLKSCLKQLVHQTKSSENAATIRECLMLLDEVPESRFWEQDFIQTATANPSFQHYQKVLDWASVFLQQQSFTNFRGKHNCRALLFPMERLFENFISTQIQRYSTDYQIIMQDKTHHLATFSSGEKQFALQPDIVLRNEKEVLILDAKWKRINAKKKRGNYGISQSDMYQLFAYGEKYSSENKEVKLALIYPKTEDFDAPLPPFWLAENRLPLFIIPFAIGGNIQAEIEQLLSYFSS